MSKAEYRNVFGGVKVVEGFLIYIDRMIDNARVEYMLFSAGF
jgi:hypothetical protein